MASTEWRPGMATSCGKCGALTLTYASDGTATCSTCGAATAPAWSRPGSGQVPPSAPAPVAPSWAPPPPGPSSTGAPYPVARRGRQRGLFLPGKASRAQRAQYVVGFVLCGAVLALVLGADIAAGTTGLIDGALIGGFGFATVIFLAGAALGRPIRWR